MYVDIGTYIAICIKMVSMKNIVWQECMNIRVDVGKRIHAFISV